MWPEYIFFYNLRYRLVFALIFEQSLIVRLCVCDEWK